MKRLLIISMIFILSCSVKDYDDIVLFYNTNKISITSLISAIEMSGIDFYISSTRDNSEYNILIFNNYLCICDFSINKKDIKNIEIYTQNNITVSLAKLLSRCIEFLNRYNLKSFEYVKYGDSHSHKCYKIGFDSIIYIIYFPDENAKNNFDIASGDILKRIDRNYWYYRYTGADGFFF